MRAVGAWIVALAVVVSGCEGMPERVEIGRRAPEYSAMTLDGDSVRLGDLEGQVVLLNVWATWCLPCREEIPALQALYEANAARGFELIGVSVDGRSEAGNVRRFAADYGVTYTIWHDPSDAISTRFQIIGVPATFVLDREGVVLWRHMGPLEADDPALNAVLEEAFAAS